MNAAHPDGSPIMHTDGFASGKGRFVVTEYIPTDERTGPRQQDQLTGDGGVAALRIAGAHLLGGQPFVPGYASGGSVSGDNWQDQDGDDESMEFGADRDFPSFAPAPQPRRDDREQREPREARDGGEQRGQREQRDYREPRQDRDQRYRAPEPVAADTIPPEGVRVVEGEPISPGTDNPFVRDARGPRGRNTDRRGGRRGEGDEQRPQRNFAAPAAEAAEPAPRFDPSSLPPAIGIRSEPVVEAPARTERPRTLRAAVPAATPVATPAPAPAPTPVETAEEPAAAPKKRGRPRKNPLPVDEG